MAASAEFTDTLTDAAPRRFLRSCGRIASTIRRCLVVSAACLATSGAMAAPAGGPPLTPAERRTIFDTLHGGAEIGEAPMAGLSDAALLEAAVRRATLELGLRIKPSAVDPLWAIAPRPRQVEAELQAARAEARLAPWLAALQPASARFRALTAARSRYLRIVQAGGWSPLPKTLKLRPGDSGPAVESLRARLAAEGYAAPDTGGAFDAGIERAVTDFQERHALQPDGVVGGATLTALNVSAEARLAQIEANLERWRWLPTLPRDRLEVDVGGAEATLYGDDAPRLSMRVVVGDPRHRTPMFASNLAAVVFNPPWNVPASIATKELLPKERAHPGYLARNDFVFVDGALRQRPGPRNSLGRLKFDFPSPFGVYLHDTPSRAAFARPARWLSHGCVRLENPRGLAAAVMAPQGWTAERIDAAIDGGETTRVALSKTVPLYVLYWTVTVAADGQATFRPDVYGWDEKLTRGLGGGPAGVKVARLDSECAAATKPQPVL